MDLTGKRLLTFDVIGTLIDFEAGIVSYFQETAGSPSDAEEILATFGHAEGEQQEQTPSEPFTQMLEPIYRRMADSLIVPSGSPDGFQSSISRWPAFPDANDALARLRGGYRLVALTNASNWALALMASTLGEPFDDTVTCEDVGVNKPDPQMFAYCTGRQSAHGYSKSETLHVAQSQYHDIGVAMRLGYTTCWVDRRRDVDGFGATPSPDEVVVPDLHVASLAEVADQLGV